MTSSEHAEGGEPDTSDGGTGNAPESGARDETDILRREVLMLKDLLQRKVAEFDNYRRRTDEEKSALVRFGAERLIVQLLPVIDDFNRSLKAGREHPDFESFYAGIDILRTKFLKVLELAGVTPIDAAGTPFDETFHEALLQVPSADVPAGTVIDEFERGYLLHDRVIRHAKVSVAAEHPSSTSDDASA